MPLKASRYLLTWIMSAKANVFFTTLVHGSLGGGQIAYALGPGFFFLWPIPHLLPLQLIHMAILLAAILVVRRPPVPGILVLCHRQ